MEREFLRPVEAAAALSLSKSRIYEALQRGEIPHTRIAGMLRIPRCWIDEQVKHALNSKSPDNQ
jgi:excisionase family DNA binding protein